MTTEKQENRTFNYEIFLEHSNTVTGILTLTFFITRVAMSYTGPWHLLFGTVGLVNILWKVWLYIRMNRTKTIGKILGMNWTQLLADVVLTLLYFHYGGLI